MIRNRFLLRTTTAFLIFEMVTSIVLPSVSWALTSGPTAPEATSFEPVDASSMVNLASGDFVYTMPLLEVPGPSGGYPLALSYHAGIQPNEDASWVGLGWTVNPGSIARSVSGFPDDFAARGNVSRAFWKGGETHTYETGVSVGLDGLASVGVGNSFSQDTYQGNGFGVYVEGGVGYKKNNVNAGANARLGISDYGDEYGSVGVSAGVGNENMGLGVNAGITTNFETVDGFAGAGLRYGPMNASIQTSTSGGLSTGVSVLGSQITINNKSGRLSTHSYGGSISIPVYAVNLNFGYKYRRYWISQLDETYANGSLYHPTSGVDFEYLDAHTFDTYSLLDPDASGGLIENSTPEKVLGGSFPDFDSYTVQAQGLGGIMRPHIYKGYLLNRNGFEDGTDSNGDDIRINNTIQHHLGYNNTPIGFRFVNDFSNRHEYNAPFMSRSDEAPYVSYDFSGTSTSGENGNDGIINGQAPGSRDIRYLTNKDIILNNPNVVQAGLIETVSSGFNRDEHGGLIGAFVITNETGVKYHFALPAYAYDEYSYSANTEETENYNDFRRPAKYAYTWYLTAITGPDFVDRGPDGSADGKLDSHDWGYWVEFEYGKWTDQYAWRNPSEGMIEDLDSKFENFSEGRKEIYYLDAIRTKTHTALFVKDIRHDGKGVAHALRNRTNMQSRTLERPLEATKKGGFIPKQVTSSCTSGPGGFPLDYGTITYFTRPTSVMKLDRVILLKNESLPAGPLAKSQGSAYAQQFTHTWNVVDDGDTGQCEPCNFSPLTIDQHLYQNVFDKFDLAASGIADQAIRTIKLATDYSLAPETSNSYDYSQLKLTSPSTIASDYALLGKLTLKSIQFFGKGDGDAVASPIPPTKFDYELSDKKSGTAELGQDLSTYSLIAAGGLENGDIFKFQSNGKMCYGVVDNDVVRILGKNKPLRGVFSYETTKNPPYNSNHYDMWGMYKCDFDRKLNNAVPDGARLVSPQSAKNLDAWSLRTITSSTGGSIGIEYEPDTYKKPVLAFREQFRVKSISNQGGYFIEIYDDEPDLQDIFRPGMKVPYTILLGDLIRVTPVKFFESRIVQNVAIVQSATRNSNGNWVIKVNNLHPSIFTILSEGPPVMLAGQITMPDDAFNLGGGIRTKSITVESMNASMRTVYDYNMNGSAVTSGVTSYEPGNVDQAIFHFPQEGDALYDYFQSQEEVKEAKDEFNKIVYKGFVDILANARELPPPSVMYEYVRVRQAVKQNLSTEYVAAPSSTEHHFKVFSEGMVGIVYTPVLPTPNSNHPIIENKFRLDKTKRRQIIVKDYSAQIGVSLGSTIYDQFNNKITETRNHYLNDELPAVPEDDNPNMNDKLELNIENFEPLLASRFRGQGVMEETYAEAHFVKTNGFIASYRTADLLAVVSKREIFPVVQTGQTTINYKTGVTETSSNLAFDFYSGRPVSVFSTDVHGNHYVTNTIPAYRKYPQMGLGAGGKANMLAQEAGSTTFRVTGQTNEPVGLVSASVQTWGTNTKVIGAANTQQLTLWRQQASHSWKGDDHPVGVDGFYPAGNFVPFDFAVSAMNSTQWQKNSTYTLFDVNSNTLEAMDINGNFAATKMSADRTTVFATAANSRYDEFAFSGAEESRVDGYYGGNVDPGNAIEVFKSHKEDVTTTHTGRKALQISSTGQKAFHYVVKAQTGRSYVASAWVNSTNARIVYKHGGVTQTINVTPSENKKAGSWYLLEATTPPAASSNDLEVWIETTGGVCNIDDFRVHPADAAMTSYVYNEFGELSDILNTNNLFIHYEYDQMGRLKETFSETFSHEVVKTSEIKYHYSGSQE